MVDWETVDIDQLLSSWQADLDACNKETIHALGIAAQESRDLLPLIDRSIKAISDLSSRYKTYSRDLEDMGRAVKAIQETNQLLTVQSNNQRTLLEYLGSLDLDMDVKGLEIVGLDDPKRVNEIELICQELAEKFKKQDPELAGMVAINEQRTKLGEACKNASSIITNYLCNTLQIHLNTHFGNQLKYMVDLLNKQHLLSIEPPAFSSLKFASAPSSSSYLLGLTGDFGSQTVHEEDVSVQQSAAKFDNIMLLDMTSGLPTLESNTKLDRFQATHYVLLHTGHWLDALFFILEQSFGKETADKLTSAGNANSVSAPFINIMTSGWPGSPSPDTFIVLAAVETRLKEARDKGLSGFAGRLEQLRDFLNKQADTFTSQQVQSIRDLRIGVKRRAGILPYVNVLPAFLKFFTPYMSTCLQITRMGKTLQTACIKQLDGLSAQADPQDDKEQVNAAVMAIENAFFLSGKLEDKQEANQCFEKALSKYIALQLPKIFGERPCAFMVGLALEYEQIANEVLFKPEYGKAQARKMMQTDLSSISSGIEYVRARVHKHFSAGLAGIIWERLKEEVKRRVSEWNLIVRSVYSDLTGGFLEHFKID